jgi:hypothetical protein
MRLACPEGVHLKAPAHARAIRDRVTPVHFQKARTKFDRDE